MVKRGQRFPFFAGTDVISPAARVAQSELQLLNPKPHSVVRRSRGKMCLHQSLFKYNSHKPSSTQETLQLSIEDPSSEVSKFFLPSVTKKRVGRPCTPWDSTTPTGLGALTQAGSRAAARGAVPTPNQIRLKLSARRSPAVAWPWAAASGPAASEAARGRISPQGGARGAHAGTLGQLHGAHLLGELGHVHRRLRGVGPGGRGLG